MGTITLPNFRTTADVTMNTRLKDGGVAIDWAGLTNIKAWLFSDAQKAIAGRCDVSIDQTDSTKLVCEYSATKPQYLGVQRLIIQAKYMGRTKTYDKAVFNFVPRTDDQEGTQIVIDDPEVDVEISVEDVSSSLIERLIAACIKATEEAQEVVNVHRGPQGLSAYEVAVKDGYEGTEEEWLLSLQGKSAYEIAVELGYEGTEEQWIASLKGEDGDPGTTPHIGQNGNWFIGDVDTGVAAGGQNGVTPHIGQNGDWFIGETDTGVLARGTNGVTPHIGDNGHWFIGDTDTNVVAEGQDGNPGITPHIGANNHWFIGETDTGILAEGTDGVTPDISIGTVTTVDPGTPAAASMSGTPEAPVLNLSIPKGAVGATPNFTVGTVTTGQPGTPVVITITGTAEAPVLNIQIPQGMKGDTGVSADYPITIHNGLDSDATDEALAAFQGKVLDGKVSRLRQEVFGDSSLIELPAGVSGAAEGQSSGNNTSGTIWFDNRTLIYPGQTVEKFSIKIVGTYGTPIINIYRIDADYGNPVLLTSHPVSVGLNEFTDIQLSNIEPVYIGYEVINSTFRFLNEAPSVRTLQKVSTQGVYIGDSGVISSYFLTVRTADGLEKRIIEVENSAQNLDNNVERLDTQINGKTISWNEGYLINGNTSVPNANVNFAYSSPVYLHRGKVVSIISGGSGVSFVTKSDEQGSLLKCLLVGESTSVLSYSYTIEEDGYYVLCYKYADSDSSLSVDGVDADSIISEDCISEEVAALVNNPVYGGMYIYPFRTIAGTDVFIFKDAVFTGLKPIENYEVFIPNSDASFAKNFSKKAIRFNAAAGTSTLHLQVRDIQGKICASKDVAVTVSSVPEAKASQKSRLNVFFFGDSIVAFNHNRIGVEFQRYLSTNDAGGTAEDGSIRTPAINICPSKINLVGELNLSDARFAYVFQLAQVFTAKRTVAYGSKNNTTYWATYNPFYNPNSSQPDEAGSDGLNKRVDFVWYFTNACPSGEYPDIIYMSVGGNDIGTPDSYWSGDMVLTTAKRLITVAKRMKAACDEMAGGTSDTKIKIFNHQSHPIYFAPYNNLPPERARNIERVYYDTIYSLIQSEGVSSYVELVDCASKFDNESGYDMGAINTNPRTTKSNDIGMLSGDGIHMNMVGAYNYADCLIRDFLADSDYD